LAKTLFLSCESLFIYLLTLAAVFIPVEDKPVLAFCVSCGVTTLYIPGLRHNLFSVGQFCDGDLEVAFRSKTCCIQNLEGDDLLTGGRVSNLYTISISDMDASSPVPKLQRFNNHNSSVEPMNIPSKEDLDNLFGPMFEEYFRKKSSDTPIDSAAQPTQLYEDSPSTSSITIDEHEAPPIETTFDEQTSPISLTKADELH
nr:integrase, catalytic region, zinc finger, CCHC-type, peptidase aspartic, catalytic [Tanacetum cinerariifolium]